MKRGKFFKVILIAVMMFSLVPMRVTTVNAAPSDSTVGISGYTSGNDWIMTEGKGLDINVIDKQTGIKQYIQIEVARGMRLATFLWNDEWGTVAANVQGSKVAMGDSEKAFLSGNEISVDANGNTTLVYEIATGTESLNLSSKITVKPDEVLSYNNDDIPNAVKVSYLDENKAEVSSATYNVNVIDNPNEYPNGMYDGLSLYTWPGSPGLYPGIKDGFLFYAGLHRVYGGENYNNFFGTNRVYTLTLPDIVDDVTRVTKRGYETTTFPFEFDETTKVLTVNMGDMAEGAWYENINVYGDISTTATEKLYDSKVPSKVKIKFYDGVEKTDLELRYSGSVRIAIGKYNSVIMPSRYDHDNNQRNNSNSSLGYPVPLISADNGWMAQEDLTVDQVVTWSSDPNTVDIKWVQFPVGKEGNVTVTSVTFDDGNTYPLNATNIGVLHSSSKTIDISVDQLKVAAGVGTSSAKYIRSVTANCGTFDKGSYSLSNTGFPVGYFSDAVISENKMARVPINYSVNGQDFTFEAIYYPEKMTSIAPGLDNPESAQSGKEFVATATISLQGLYPVAKEPNLFVVVPDGFEFNPTKVTAKDNKNTDLSSKIKYSYKEVKNEAGERFDAYSFYVEDSVISYYTDTEVNYLSQKIIFNLPFRVSESAKLGQFDLGNYVMVGKGEFDGEFVWNKNTISYQVISDIWDFNGDNDRNDRSIVRRQVSNISVLEDKNISVSGYLTEKGKPGVVEAYNPGADGSSDVNAVTFTTGTEVDYHVVVKSTLDTNNTSANVRAYIPLPDANVSGGTSTPNNTGGSADERYQFGDYKWPMTLVSDITNPNSSIYKITYWLNEVDLDTNGNPVATANTVTKSELTSADYSKVVLVQIDGTGIPMNSETELKMTLKVNVNSAEALSANINGTKNIFRPYFYRTSDAGSGYNSGNYVAAKLEIGAIGGKVFLDVDGNGLYEVSKGDTALGNVTVQLLDGSGSLIETKTTSNATTTKGEYRFENLSNGTYTVKVINNNTNRRFSKPVTDAAATYTINSDVTAATDHTSASYQISIPEGIQFDSAQLYINAGLVGKADVYVKAEPSQGGTLAGQTVANFTKLPVGDFFIGYTVADGLGTAANTFESLIVANTGYVFKNWKIGNNTYTTEELKKVVVDSSRIEAIAVFAEDKNNNGEDDTTEKFTVIFKDGNTELKKVENLSLGATVATYTPTKTNYLFDKWDPAFQNKVRAEDANRNSEIIYTATWKDDKNNDGKDDATQKFTVIFKDGDTELKKVENLSLGAKVDEYKPTKTNYLFDKWTPTFKNTVDASMADKNAVITYTASWKDDKNNDGKDDATQKFTVIFKDGDTELKKVENLSLGAKVDEYKPTKENYLFDKWTPTFKNTVDASMADKNAVITYTASWKDDKNNNGEDDATEKFTVIFKDGDTVLEKYENLSVGDDVTELKPTKENYLFDKWTPTFQNKVRAEDANRNNEIIYTATWKDDKNNDGKDDATQKFTVIFKDGDTELKKVENLSLGAKVDEYKPTKENYLFDKWTPTFKNTVDASMADKNAVITYTASWKDDKNNNGEDDATEKFTVIFKDGDTVLEKYENLSVGADVTELKPTKENYLFDKWTPDFKDKVDASMANKNGEIIYQATWKDDKNNNGEDDATEKFTVIFKDGDTVLEKYENLSVGADVTELKPTKENYLFDKWTPDFKDKVDASMANKNGEIIYQATWKDDKNNNGEDDATEKFTVIFKDGNTVLEKYKNLSVGADVTELKPTKENYLFDKWTPDFKDKVDASMANKNGEIIYQATWKDDKNNNGIDDDLEEKIYTYEFGSDATYVKGSNKDLEFVITRNIDNQAAFDHFTGELWIDENKVPNSAFEASSGSVKHTLKASYLETLSLGEHKLVAMFDDGMASTKLTVVENPNNKRIVDTNDNSNISLYGIMFMTSIIIAIGAAYTLIHDVRKKYSR